MPARDDRIPPLTPRYETLRELGRGGLGRVFLVRDLHLGREVALKLLLARPDEDAIEAFRREFSLLSEIEHPGIARAFDFGYAGGVPFYTSEFIDGTSLDEGLEPGDAGRLLARFREVAEALSFLHGQGILHLDVKPGNILVRGPPGKNRAVLIDFGLFRRGLEARSGDRIQGSLAYMAPEYFRGGRIGPWTDVYAFGVTLYKLLASRVPRPGVWEGRRVPLDPSAWDPAPPPPSRFSPSTPAGLDAITLRCLALDPEARYESAAGIVDALERVSGRAPGASRPDGTAATTAGREAELERFESFLRPFRPGEGDAAEDPAGVRVVLVTGAAGMGQSHLLREMKVRAQTLGVPFYLETGYRGRPTVPGSLLRCLATHLEDPRARARWEGFLERVRRPRGSPRSETSEAERRLRRAAEISLAVSSARAFILAVDGLQFHDEVSIGLILDLVRAGGEPPRLGLVLGYREEGASAGLLRELTDELSRRETTIVLALRPLGIDAAWSLYRSRAPGAAGRAMDVYCETAGIPARVTALAASGGKPPGRPGLPPARPTGVMADAGADERRCILVLDLLGRPAGAPELARVARLSRKRAIACLGKLEERGLASGGVREGQREWVIEQGAGEVARGADPAELRLLHRRIAEDLAERARAPSDPRTVEIASHFEEARMPAAARRFSLAAARYLRSTLQSRAALGRYRAALDAVPARQRGRRIDLALEMASLQARIGDYDAGVESLKDLLAASKDSLPAERARILLWLATLHGRKGELRRAAGLFEEGFRMARRRSARPGGRARRPALRKDETLYFLNELASLRTFTGDYREAVRLCDEGFRLAGRRRSFAVRELVINLHATRGNVALRTFDHAGACRSLETALEIAEAIGSPESQAVILNNLGIALSSLDRYAEAIQAYRSAEKLSLRLDEGPSLVSIYGNLAILHAKTADWPSMEEALAAGVRMGAAAIGIKQELFLSHARGLCLLHRGHFHEARLSFDEAIRLAEKVGDAFIAAFDSVYRAEAALHEGALADARRQLEELSAGDSPARVRKMALSRLAFVHAISGRGDIARACVTRSAGERAGPPVAFLDAWDGLYIAWALSAAWAGEEEDAASCLALLAKSASFFRKHAVQSGAVLAEWILAERAFLRRDLEGARRVLSGIRAAGNDFTSVLVPLLASRVRAEAAEGVRDLEACADLLAGAEEKLTGNPLPEWEMRILVLRAALDAPGGPAAREVEEGRRRIAGDLGVEDRRRYLESPYWKRWAEGIRLPRAEGVPARPGRRGDDAATARTASLPREDGPASRRGVVARSPAMKEVISFLDRIRDSELPVLIEGETGSGKEMVGRIIHQESRRSAGPFVVVDCSAIPEALVEAELHGARAGAFTDSRSDRPGLVAAAARGTLLVDEVARIPLALQAKLLRTVSEGTYRRLGDEVESASDVRFLFTSSLDLEEEAAAGRLRRDFLHRIRVLRVRVPPLRERREDIPLLIDRLLEERKVPPPALGRGVLERLCALPWPGNVRELENALARLSLEGSRRISLEALEAYAAGSGAAGLFPRRLLEREGLPALKESLEREYVLHHLERLRGDTTALSRHLGISRLQLYRRCHRLGIRLRSRSQGPRSGP